MVLDRTIAAWAVDTAEGDLPRIATAMVARTIVVVEEGIHPWIIAAEVVVLRITMAAIGIAVEQIVVVTTIEEW